VRGFPSFRARILILVLVVALVPLGLVGWWLTRSAARSGENLLRVRLDEALERAVADIGQRWVGERSSLLTLAESPGVQTLLSASPRQSRVAPPDVERLFTSVDGVDEISVRDTNDRVMWTIARRDTAGLVQSTGGAPLHVRLEIFQTTTGRRLGTLEVLLRGAALLSPHPNTPFVSGVVVAALDPVTGLSLAPIPFDPANLRLARFRWIGEDWLAERRSLADPRMDLVASAPLTSFTAPFTAAASQGAWLLGGTAGMAMLAAFMITTRMTRNLRRLANAAEAVSRGDLSRTTDVQGDDEVGRVAFAFNTMTASLKQTLGDLAQREALTAVGSFATDLAHEVRNPLSAIRVDLQLVEEQLPDGSPARAIQRNALEEVDRLNATVSGVLQLARSGNIEMALADLTEVLCAAARAAQAEFDRRGAYLDLRGIEGAPVIRGDPGALRRLFLNLLLNAGQALGPGGHARLHIETPDDRVVVVLEDTGAGIPPGVLDRVREPFFSTKSDGTGLGLAIAQRIVSAHGGRLEIDSEADKGTRVRVHLTRERIE
jgi:signal transduction histidine kinase